MIHKHQACSDEGGELAGSISNAGGRRIRIRKFRLIQQRQIYGKSNGHAQKAVMVQRGQVVGTRNTSVCSENVSSVFSYWLFSIQSYKISQGSYAWVHNDICIVKERKMCT